MTALSFTKDASGMYVASFTSAGEPVAVQLHQSKGGALIFMASIGTMTPIPVKVLAGWEHGLDYITTVNVPNGVKITIRSEQSVTGGYEG